MTNPPQSGEWYFTQMQRELDRRFTDLQINIDRRFTEVDNDIKMVQTDVKELKNAPKDTFRAYVTPIIVSLVTALLLAFLVSQGVSTK